MPKLKEILDRFESVKDTKYDVEHDYTLAKGCRCLSCFDVDYETIEVTGSKGEELPYCHVEFLENVIPDMAYLMEIIKVAEEMWRLNHTQCLDSEDYSRLRELGEKYNWEL